MPHSPTVSTSDLTFDTLFEEAAANVSGHWFTVRLMPDLVTGELFNIGVALVANDGKLHYKLLADARPFQCLFGDRGLENFNFLLTTVKSRFAKQETLPASPHIILSDHRYTAGDSVADILDTLYSTMVNLQCPEDTSHTVADNSQWGTPKLRQQIFNRLKKELPQVHERIYRDTPVYIRDEQGENGVYIDLPIWNGNGNLHDQAPSCFGSIVSATYKSEVHRRYHIEHGSLNTRNACDLLGKKAKGGFFIFRPPVAAGFSEALQRQIDNEIDSTVYSLRKLQKNGYPLTVLVTDNRDEIYQAAAALA